MVSQFRCYEEPKNEIVSNLNSLLLLLFANKQLNYYIFNKTGWALFNVVLIKPIPFYSKGNMSVSLSVCLYVWLYVADRSNDFVENWYMAYLKIKSEEPYINLL